MNGRMSVFYVEGVRYQAPEIWMMARHYQGMLNGLTPKESTLEAMKLGAEQEEMERKGRN